MNFPVEYHTPFVCISCYPKFLEDDNKLFKLISDKPHTFYDDITCPVCGSKKVMMMYGFGLTDEIDSSRTIYRYKGV